MQSLAIDEMDYLSTFKIRYGSSVSCILTHSLEQFPSTFDSQMLTVVLSLFVGQYEVAWEDMAAAAVVTMLPPFLIALFFQRFLIRGMTLGAVK